MERPVGNGVSRRALLVLLLACGCGSGDERAKRGGDAGAEEDAGGDAGADEDAGTDAGDGGIAPPRPGWVVGDTHVHTNGCEGSLTPAELLDLLVAQDIDVGCVLVWGSGWATDHGYFTGDDDPASLPGRILHYDLEVSAFPAGNLTHLNLLGLSSIDFSDDPFVTPGSGVPIVDWALAQGERVLVGANHGQWWPDDGTFPGPGFSCCTAFELPIHVARERAHFLEVEMFTRGGWFLWKTLQNTGFRVALAGASDYPCIYGEVGVLVTHAQIEGDFTYEAFLDAIRSGRTVIAGSEAGWMDLTANDARLGDEIEIGSGETVRIAVDTDVPESATVELVRNGEIVDTVTVDPGPDRAAFDLVFDESGWISAAVRGVWTSAIYVLVDGQPIRPSADDACYLVRYVDHLVGLEARGAAFRLGSERDEVLAAWAEARGVFLDRFVEAGGGTCE